MGFVGFDELSLVVKGLNGAKATHYAQTSDDAAGRGYNTNARNNRKDHFHVKWHPVYKTHVVDRFHVKNETTCKAIYYGISRSRRLIYLTAGPDGMRCGNEHFGQYLLEDCDEIANIFLDSICRSGIEIYEDCNDAEKAHEARSKSEGNAKALSDEKNTKAVQYSQVWRKMSPKDQAANPMFGAVEIRQKSLLEVTEILEKITRLAYPNQPAAQSPPPDLGPVVPHGSIAIPGATAYLAPALASTGEARV